MLPDALRRLGGCPPTLCLGERLLVVEVALDFDLSRRQQAGLDGLPPFDLDVPVVGAKPSNAGPERLVGIVGPRSLQHGQQLLAACEADPQTILPEHVEIADGASLVL